MLNMKNRYLVCLLPLTLMSSYGYSNSIEEIALKRGELRKLEPIGIVTAFSSSEHCSYGHGTFDKIVTKRGTLLLSGDDTMSEERARYACLYEALECPDMTIKKSGNAASINLDSNSSHAESDALVAECARYFIERSNSYAFYATKRNTGSRRSLVLGKQTSSSVN